MPIEFVDQEPLGSTFVDYSAPDSPQQPSLGRVASAAFQTENDVYAAYSAVSERSFKDQPDHDPMEIIRDTPYEQFTDNFVGSRSEDETRFVMEKIDREQQNSAILADAGLPGLALSIGAGILSPTMLMPGGALYKGYRTGTAALKTGASTAAMASAGVAAQEVILQTGQETRTATDSAVAIGSAAVLGGLLGGGISLLSKADQVKLGKRLDSIQTTMDDVEAGYTGMSNSSAGAAQADLRSAKLKDEKVAKVFNMQDPTLRLKVSPSTTSRRAVNDLAENPLENVENADFVASSVGGSVESRMKAWQGPLAESVNSLSDNFAKYFYGGDVGGVKRAVAPIRSEFANPGKLSYHEFKIEVGKALRRGDRHEVPEVEATAQVFRQKLFNPGKERAIKAGLFEETVDISTAESYLTRVYNRELIEARRDEFSGILGKHFQFQRSRAQAQIDELSAKGEALDAKLQAFADHSNQEIAEIVDDVIDRILGNHTGRLDFDIIQGPRGPLRERVLNIRDTEIENFLESDVEAISRQYTRTMSADVELKEKFGDVDLQTKLDEVREEYNAKIAKATGEKSRIKLEKRKNADMRDIAAIRDRLRGTYAMPDNPSGLLVRSGRVVRSLNYMRLLGGMTISALPDLAKPVFVHGMNRTIKTGIMPMLKNMKTFRASNEEVKLAGTALDMALDTRAMAIADLMDNYGKQTKFERLVSSGASKFGVVSLMAPWNAFLKQFAGTVALSRMLKAMTAATIDPKDIRLLAASGIDKELAARIGKQFKSHGEVVDGVYLPNTLEWTDNEARTALRAALVRDVDRTVVTPGQDKPLWMSTEVGGLIGQFKSFGIASVQRTLIAGIQQRDAAVYVGTAMMLALGSATYAMKQVVAGKDVSTEPSVLVANAIDRSGLLGWLADANNITEKATRGKFGLSLLTGEQISRYQSRNIYGTFMGPTADAVADTFQISGSIFAGDVKDSDTRKARRLLPFQNLFYLRWLIDEVEGSGN